MILQTFSRHFPQQSTPRLGNGWPAFVTEDPYGEFEQCAPYAVNVQIKTEMKTPKKGVLAHADLQRVAQILKNANYRGNVVMEYEEEDSYDGVPGAMDKLRTYFGG